MATFVLVHGGWHGAWCWRRVVALLRAAGHEVHTPTLTGLGERVHLAGPSVGLSTHVQDVVNVLAYEDLDGVVLVGHSYGGMVITGVAGCAPERLAHLVYLDAFVPRPGQALFDLFPGADDFRRRARERGDGWRVPPTSNPQPYGVTDPGDASWVHSKVTAHPLRCFEEPLPTPPEVPVQPVADPPTTPWRTYIFCGPPFGTFGEQARNDRSWRYRELLGAHDAMVTAPGALAALLLEAAEP